MRPIDADELIKTLNSVKYFGMDSFAKIQNFEIDRCISFVEDEPSVKTFTRSELEGWLYEIYMNNIDGHPIDKYFAGYVEEIINRLDGFERYVEDKRRENNEAD